MPNAWWQKNAGGRLDTPDAETWMFFSEMRRHGVSLEQKMHPANGVAFGCTWTFGWLASVAKSPSMEISETEAEVLPFAAEA